MKKIKLILEKEQALKLIAQIRNKNNHWDSNIVLANEIEKKIWDRYGDYSNFETECIAKYIESIYKDDIYKKELNNANIDNYDKFCDYITSTEIHYITAYYLNDEEVEIDNELLDTEELDALIKKLCIST